MYRLNIRRLRSITFACKTNTILYFYNMLTALQIEKSYLYVEIVKVESNELNTLRNTFLI